MALYLFSSWWRLAPEVKNLLDGPGGGLRMDARLRDSNQSRQGEQPGDLPESKHLCFSLDHSVTVL